MLRGLSVSLVDGLQYPLFILLLQTPWPFRLDQRCILTRIFKATFGAVVLSIPALILLPRTLLYLFSPQEYPWPGYTSLCHELELFLMSNPLGIILVVPLGLALMSRRLKADMRDAGTLLLGLGILLVLGLPNGSSQSMPV